MECPHLLDNCKIKCDFIKIKKSQLIDSRCNRNDVVIIPGGSSSSSNNGPQKLWKCTDCQSTKNNWICLKCGAVLCGRYEKAHALNHFNNLDHKVCMNTLNYSVYCYKCDDFVVNETNEIEEIRNYIKVEDDSSSETSSTTTTTTLEESSSTITSTSSATTSSSSSSSRSINSHSQETASISSNDSGWEEPRQIVSGRKLRPRKRTNSNDSSIENNSVSKRKNARKSKGQKDFKVVGLRNLGNTCFMNSVLQSLSNIQEFSCYFSALPSLEQQQQQSINNNNKQKQQQQQRVYHSRSLKENLNDANVVEELRKVLINLSKGGDNQHKAISPECLFLVIWKVVPQFRGHRQHDAHEFLRYMLDRLHTELQHLSIDPLLNSTITSTYNNSINNKSGNVKLNSSSSSSSSTTTTLPINSLLDNCSNNNGNGIYTYKGGKSSIVTNVFGGTLQSEVRCLICGMESKKHDPFLDLSLDIPEKFFKNCSSSSTTNSNNNNNNNNSNNNTVTGGDNNINKSSDTKPVCNIKDCLSSFTEVEELAETELYYCNSCKCKQKSTKRFWIRRLPNVLCLHIKRFRWNNFFRTKIDLRISFPINSLDMSQYVLNNGPETRRNSQLNNVYDLAAVIVHHGNGSSCGHYTSYAINNGTWLHFNDHTVKEVPPTAVADCKPYILFYIRRDISSSASLSTTTVSSASTSSTITTSIGNNNSNLNKTL